MDTTPGRLRFASLVVLGLAVVTGLVGVVVIGDRRDGVGDVTARSEPLLYLTQDVFASLAAADAAAATAFLAGGVEPSAQRQAYTSSIRQATTSLTAAIALAPSGRAKEALGSISEQLPVYTGLVDGARAGNRQGLPLGAAYLRQASALMQGTMLPAGEDLYRAAAGRLANDLGRASDPVHLVLFGVVAGVLLVALAVTNVFLFRRTRRVFNPALVLASVAAAGAFLLVVTSLLVERSAMSTAKTEGSDQVQLLAQVRILALRAKGAESLSLVARGNGQALDREFAANVAALGGTGFGPTGVVDRTVSLPPRDELARTVTTSLEAYLAAHDELVTAQATGYQQAAAFALSGDPAGLNASFARLDDRLRQELDADQQRFVTEARRGRRLLYPLAPLLVALLVGTAVLSIVGLQVRINEYR